MKICKFIRIAGLLVFALLFPLAACSQPSLTPDTPAVSAEIPVPEIADVEITTPEIAVSASPAPEFNIFAELFAEKKSGVQVMGGGVVTKILTDDDDGGKHQRFVVTLATGQTLLIAHNIDVAPRVEPLEIGDTVEFYGEYFYNEEGGGVHWTHKDPGGNHADGYIERDGVIFDYAARAEFSPEPVYTVIGNKNSKVYHSPDCESLPSAKNRVYFDSPDEARQAGMRPHKECTGS